jgi:cytochrome P450
MFDTMIAVREEFEKQEDEAYRMSDRDMAEAAIGVIIAGNDTSGLGIQGLLGMVAAFPEVLQQLRKEQQEVRGMKKGLTFW